MQGGRKRSLVGWPAILLGSVAIAVGIVIVAFPRLGLLLKVLILAGGLLVVGVAKVSTARQGRHLTPLLRTFGLGMGAVAIGVAAWVFASALVVMLGELFPAFSDAFPSLIEGARLLTVGLLLIILAATLVLYGIDRLLEGYGALLPTGERIVLVAIGSASVALAVLTLAFPTLGRDLIVLILVFALFSMGLGAILVGIHTVRTRPIGELGPAAARVGEAGDSESAWEPKAQLHCFVVGSRREIVESLGNLARRANLKFQQGALEPARGENMDEQRLFERLRGYAEQFGDLEPREGGEWAAIEEQFKAFQRKAARKKFQWLRPIGSVTSKIHVTRIAYVLRKTPIDLAGSGSAFSIGGSWASLRKAVARAKTPISEDFFRQMEDDFALFRGGLPAKGAFILHIVGLPVDVDSDQVGDIYDDDATALWDFGASHTEVGALDPSDHLMSRTTNFLLGPSVLFQHFFDEGRAVALIRKGHAVRAAWGRRVVTHLSNSIDVELAFKQGVVTLPNPIARKAAEDGIPAPDTIVLSTTRIAQVDPHTIDKEEAWDSVGISAGALRKEGFERIDWDFVRALMGAA